MQNETTNARCFGSHHLFVSFIAFWGGLSKARRPRRLFYPTACNCWSCWSNPCIYVYRVLKRNSLQLIHANSYNSVPCHSIPYPSDSLAGVERAPEQNATTAFFIWGGTQIMRLCSRAPARARVCNTKARSLQKVNWVETLPYHTCPVHYRSVPYGGTVPSMAYHIPYLSLLP